MGQCYSINLKLKFSDENGAKKALLAKISRAREERVNYNLDHYRELGIKTETIEDLMRIFFGGWKGALRLTNLTKEFAKYESDFDCSYGWEDVMMTAFEEIAPFLKDKSEIKIYPDSGVDRGIVQNGMVEWK